MRPEKNLAPSSARLLASGKQSIVRTVAVTVLAVLCFSGCASSRKSVTTSSQVQVAKNMRADSVVHLSAETVIESVEVRTTPMTVPKSEVTLTIPTDSLRRLPSGAVYTGRNGQANVHVSRVAATRDEPERIYVYASCDSLQLQCERYERTIRNLHIEYGEMLSAMYAQLEESHSQEEVSEKPPNGIGTRIKWYLAGLLSGIIVTIIIFIKLKK